MRAVMLSAGTGVLITPFTVDADTDLQGCVWSKTGFLSYDPAAVIADFQGPTATAIKNSAIVGGNANNAISTGLRIPLYKGEVVYLVSSGGISVILYFEDRT